MSGLAVFSLRHSSLPEFEMPLKTADSAQSDPSGSGPHKRLD